MKKKVLLCLLFCLLLIPLPGMKSGQGEGVTRCLLIGCDRFVSMPGTEPASANNVDTRILADGWMDSIQTAIREVRDLFGLDITCEWRYEDGSISDSVDNSTVQV